jgi:2-keto-4-pentenoate hydratase
MANSLDQTLQRGLREQQAGARELLAGGATRLGWKAGFGTAAAMENLGTDGPLAGFLTDSTLAPSGTAFDVSGWDKPVLETEVAVRLAADIAAGQSGAEIEAAVGGVAAAIELVDLGEAGTDPGAILAANIFHRAVLLGDFVELGEDASLADVRIDVLAADGDDVLGADPAILLGDLTAVLAGMADLLDGSDDSLRSGDVIITGAAIKPFALAGGESVEVRVGASSVSARIG